MGLKQSNVSEDDNESFDDKTPVIEKGYYWGTLKSGNFYEKNGSQKIALQFQVEGETKEGETVSVTVPFFASAKVSCYARKDVDFANSSDLGSILESFGGVQVFDEYVGADGDLVSGDTIYEVEAEEDREEFLNGLKAAMSGREYELNVKRQRKTDSDGNKVTDGDGEPVFSNIVASVEEAREVESFESGSEPDESGEAEDDSSDDGVILDGSDTEAPEEAEAA